VTNMNPMEPVRRLAKRVAEKLEPLGLNVEAFTVMPSLDDGPDHAQVLMTIDSANLGRDIEQAKVDAEFEALTRGFQEQEEEEKLRAQQDALRKRFQQGGSFLGGDGT
jgi:hypothetical protein